MLVAREGPVRAARRDGERPVLQAGHPVPRAARRRALLPDAADPGRRRRAAARPLLDRRRRPPQPGRRRTCSAGCGASGARSSTPTSSPRSGWSRCSTTTRPRSGAVHLGVVYVADAAGRPGRRSARPTSSRARSSSRPRSRRSRTASRRGAGSSSSHLRGFAQGTIGPSEVIVTRRIGRFAARVPAPARAHRVARRRPGRARPAATSPCCPPPASSTTSWRATSRRASPRPPPTAPRPWSSRSTRPGGSLDATQRIVIGAAGRPAADDRVGRPVGRPGRECRHVHHARRPRGA